MKTCILCKHLYVGSTGGEVIIECLLMYWAFNFDRQYIYTPEFVKEFKTAEKCTKFEEE